MKEMQERQKKHVFEEMESLSSIQSAVLVSEEKKGGESMPDQSFDDDPIITMGGKPSQNKKNDLRRGQADFKKLLSDNIWTLWDN